MITVLVIWLLASIPAALLLGLLIDGAERRSRVRGSRGRRSSRSGSAQATSAVEPPAPTEVLGPLRRYAAR